jgi:hypothetical protein
MRQQERTAAITAASGVSVVALTAALVSFSHIRRLALEAGESQLAAWLVPVSIDGAIAAAVAVILADSRAGRRPAGPTWLLLALGLGCSLAGNIASAEPTMTARAVAAWPPVALALGIEVPAGLARHPDAARTAPPAVPADRLGGDSAGANGRPAATAGKRSTAVVDSINGNKPMSGQGPRPRADSESVALIQQLDAAAPGGRASRLQIQQRLGCGGSRAARLAALARPELVAAPSIGGDGRGYPQDRHPM